MKQNKFSFAVFLAALSAVVVLAAAPAYARQGSDDSTSDDSVTSSQQSDSETENDSSSDNATETETETEHGTEVENEVEHNVAMFKQHGREKLALRRADKEHHTVAQRQKTCENIQKAVNNKLSAFNNNADKYLSRLDDVFTKLQDYQTANNVSADNYESLLTTAKDNQTTAAAAVTALSQVADSLDCTESDPAAMLATAKESASGTRDALKAYRTALKNIVVALAQAQGEDVTTTEDN